MWSWTSHWTKKESQLVMPTPNDGTFCTIVTLPGMRETLLTLNARSKPPFGRISPVSKVKRPGLPSSAGMGPHLPEVSESLAYDLGAGAGTGDGAGVEGVAAGCDGASAVAAGAGSEAELAA